MKSSVPVLAVVVVVVVAAGVLGHRVWVHVEQDGIPE